MDAPSKRAIFARGLKILKPPSQHLSLNFEIKKEKQTQIRFKILLKSRNIHSHSIFQIERGKTLKLWHLRLENRRLKDGWRRGINIKLVRRVEGERNLETMPWKLGGDVGLIGDVELRLNARRNFAKISEQSAPFTTNSLPFDSAINGTARAHPRHFLRGGTFNLITTWNGTNSASSSKSFGSTTRSRENDSSLLFSTLFFNTPFSRGIHYFTAIYIYIRMWRIEWIFNEHEHLTEIFRDFPTEILSRMKIRVAEFTFNWPRRIFHATLFLDGNREQSILVCR